MTCIEIVNAPELNPDRNSEMQTDKESWTLQEWINQSHKNQMQLEQRHVTETWCQKDQSRKEESHKEDLLSTEIKNLKMNQNQSSEDDNKTGNDHKPMVQEKKQADERNNVYQEYDDYTTDTDRPMKKKKSIRKSLKWRRKKECSKA